MDTYERKYKEALERARVLIDEGRVAVEKGTTTCEYIFPELKESEDEKIRKEIIYHVQYCDDTIDEDTEKKMLAWLEKQGDYNRLVAEMKERKELISKEKEKVTSTNDKLSLGGRIAILEELLAFTKEKQGEQKPADKVGPKFKVGDWIVYEKKCYKVIDNSCGYELIDQNSLKRPLVYGVVDNNAHLWTIEDAKDGDVLVYEGEIFMIQSYALWNKVVYHCCYDGKNLHKYSIYGSWRKEDFYKVHPATKEQRDLLFQKMKEAGYEWDADKKELKKIERNPTWSEEDEKILGKCIDAASGYYSPEDKQSMKDWLKSLKPQPQWKPTDEQMEALDKVYKTHGADCECRHIILGLLNDLKKL